MKINCILEGDCLDVLERYPDNCVDLILTSPPYANQRKKQYNSIHEDEYVEWFLDRSEQFMRVLKPSGTFILNIREHTKNGEKSTYVIELILALKKQGWLWTEEFIWHKKNPYPGGWPNRLKNAWERCLQFNKNKKYSIYKINVAQPMKKQTIKRMNRLSKRDCKNAISKTGSGFAVKQSNFAKVNFSYPSNVLHFSTEASSKQHPALFPNTLANFFIKLFSKEGDIILDPFSGSGTTGICAKKLDRQYICIDTEEKYNQIARKELDELRTLFDCV